MRRLFADWKSDQLRPHSRAVFLILEGLAARHADGRIAAAPRWIETEFGLSAKIVRGAYKELQNIGLIKIETKARGYTFVTILLARHKGAGKGAGKGAANYSKIQPELLVEGATNGATKGATGVDVRRVVGVDVSHVVDVIPVVVSNGE